MLLPKPREKLLVEFWVLPEFSEKPPFGLEEPIVEEVLPVRLNLLVLELPPRLNPEDVFAPLFRLNFGPLVLPSLKVIFSYLN